jgi:hypothetical protein
MSDKKKSPSRHATRVAGFLAVLEIARERLTSHTLPPAPIVEHALKGMLNRRTGYMLASAPGFERRPLAHLLYSMVEWHRNPYASLHGPMSWRHLFSCLPGSIDGAAVRAHYGENDKAAVAACYDEFETLAICLTGGKSAACDAWQAAIGEHRGGK